MFVPKIFLVIRLSLYCIVSLGYSAVIKELILDTFCEIIFKVVSVNFSVANYP